MNHDFADRARSGMAMGLLVTVSTMVVTGCGNLPERVSPGDTLDTPGADTSSPADAEPNNGGVVSFVNDIQPIFTARCAVCHSQGGIADLAGIALRLVNNGRSWGLLVDQPSVQRSDLTLVVPGDAEASLLYLKISSNIPPVGARMPLGPIPLSQDQTSLIREWIDQGALNN